MDKGYKAEFRTVNMITGEIIEGIPVYVAPKVHWKEGWFMGFQDAFIALAKDREITLETRRVFDYLLGNLGFENYIAIPQTQIAKELKMQKSHVSEAIKTLITKGIILEGPKLGRTKTYRLNSHYGWKGTIKNLEKDRKTVIPFPQDPEKTEKP